jgi:single-strand DNA-binding protein
MYINKAIIIGNLTRDPELKNLPSGSAVANFSVATNRTWKDKAGAKQEDVEYHNVVAFGRTAEVIAQYVHKGDQIYIEGRIQTRSWEKEGVKQYRTEIVCETMQFGSKKSGTSAPAPREQEESSDIELPPEEINPEDIPF